MHTDLPVRSHTHTLIHLEDDTQHSLTVIHLAYLFTITNAFLRQQFHRDLSDKTAITQLGHGDKT